MNMKRDCLAAAVALACGLAAPAAQAQLRVAAPPVFEGALGALVTYGAEYPGAEKSGAGLKPAFYLRYRRVSISNASGFVTRRFEDSFPGLGVDLGQDARLHLKLTLRYDRGRSDTGSAALAGMGSIDKTVRTRLSGSWTLADDFRVGASWSVDLLGKGGGNLVDFGIARDHHLSPVTVWSLGGSVTLGGDRYMQSYFGVNAAQSARTGYAVYAPGGG
ncbi:MAG: MipA/OmpV family protein, partial [Rubrivivax sp.]|nr:MipA/OmpV family protein [Rubrivivax sp.]